MTIEEMRTLTELPAEATNAEVVAAYAALIDDGIPDSITLVEPVNVAMAKLQCKIDDEIEDELIEQKISSAREWCEEFTGQIFVRQTLVAHFSSWGSYLDISKRPIISVDAIAYNGSDVDSTYEDALYNIGPNPLRIYPGSAGFPALRNGGGIMVAYTAGYDVGEVPKRVIEAILVIVDGSLNNRDGAYETSLKAAANLLSRLRVPVL